MLTVTWFDNSLVLRLESLDILYWLLLCREELYSFTVYMDERGYDVVFVSSFELYSLADFSF